MRRDVEAEPVAQRDLEQREQVRRAADADAEVRVVLPRLALADDAVGGLAATSVRGGVPPARLDRRALCSDSPPVSSTTSLRPARISAHAWSIICWMALPLISASTVSARGAPSCSASQAAGLP